MDFIKEIAAIADKYRSEGYQVLLQPSDLDCPEFARGRDVDLIVERDGEKALVQIKPSRLDINDKSIKLAESVDQHADWRFDLVILNTPTSSYDVSPEAAEPSLERIEQELAAAEHISSTGDARLSCVVSWAALEATLRRAAREAGIPVRSPEPTYLLRALYAGGVLQRQEFDDLNDAIKTRDALVHGLTVPAISPTLPKYLVGIARRLLEHSKKPAA